MRNPKVLVDLVCGLERDILDIVKNVGGPWEQWLQIELARALAKRNYTVCREAKYPQSRKFADLVLTTRPGAVDVIEIKVESSSEDGTIWGDEFLAKVGEDIEKTLGFAQQGIRVVKRMALVVTHSASARYDLSSEGHYLAYRQASEVAAALFDSKYIQRTLY